MVKHGLTPAPPPLTQTVGRPHAKGRPTPAPADSGCAARESGRFARNGAIIGVSVNLQPDTEIDLGDQAAEVHKLLSR